mgnify:CR=1 FL=1
MIRQNHFFLPLATASLFVLGFMSCTPKDNSEDPFSRSDILSHRGFAQVLSSLDMDAENLSEVYDAVSESSINGYDEEYMLSDLIASPGSGVGASSTTKASRKTYSRPLRNMLQEYLEQFSTKSGGPMTVQRYLELLSDSKMQIYWPYSDQWDGKTFPVITFDPGDGSESNYGYFLSDDGMSLDSILVTERVAQERPVWVVNLNDDSLYTPLESLDPFLPTGTKAQEEGSKVLRLKSFKMYRNYDSWLAGASEFFLKCGAVNGFRATKDEDLLLYNPSVTDCMIVVRRSQLGRTLPFDSILLTDFTPQMENIAFLIHEDDGGTTTEWKCEAVVKYNSKSYGFTINIPYKDRDDIVWRGSLSRDFLLSGSNRPFRMGDVEIVLELE